MKFSIDRNALLSVLTKIGLVIRAKSSMEVYKCYLFIVDGNSLSVKATDTEIFMSQNVSIDNTSNESRTFALYARQFCKAIKTLESQALEIEVLEYQVIVRHKIGEFALPLWSDYEPLKDLFGRLKPINQTDKDHFLQIETPGLVKILNRCIGFTADDELRPVMNGVCIDFTQEHTDFVASDGHKLIRIRKGKMLNESTYLIIQKQIVSIMQKVLPTTGFVDLLFRVMETFKDKDGRDQMLPGFCRIFADGVEIIFTPIPGRYPNYNSVIPANYSREVEISRLDVIKSVDRLAQFANDSSQLITFSLNPGSLTMQAKDVDFETSGTETIPCEYSGDSLRIGYKAPTLVKILRSVTTNSVIWKITNEHQASIFLPKPQPDFEDITMLMMPMLIND